MSLIFSKEGGFEQNAEENAMTTGKKQRDGKIT
jgi:hypothetical protein